MLSDMNRRNEAVSQACHDALRSFWSSMASLAQDPQWQSAQLRRVGLAFRQRCALSAMPVAPIPSLIIPCHRGAGKADVGGYTGAKSGSGMRMKRWLLAHEAGG